MAHKTAKIGEDKSNKQTVRVVLSQWLHYTTPVGLGGTLSRRALLLRGHHRGGLRLQSPSSRSDGPNVPRCLLQGVAVLLTHLWGKEPAFFFWKGAWVLIKCSL